MGRHDQGWRERMDEELRQHEQQDMLACARGIVVALAIIGALWVAFGLAAWIIGGWHS